MRLNPSIDEPSKPMPSLERPSSSCDGDRERLQEPEDVGEPQPDEPDPPLLDRAQDVGGLVGEHAPRVGAAARRPVTDGLRFATSGRDVRR